MSPCRRAASHSIPAERAKRSGRDCSAASIGPAWGVIIDGKRDWVAHHLERFEAANLPPASLAPPREFRLLALAETWRVEYQIAPAKVMIARTAGPGRIVVTGQVENMAAGHAVFTAGWPAGAGRAGAVAGVLVRRDRATLWRGCHQGQNPLGQLFGQGGINLNYKLLFLPREWVRYVLIHELCHTAELNHSPRFWDLVQRFEPRAGRSARRSAMRGHIYRPGCCNPRPHDRAAAAVNAGPLLLPTPFIQRPVDPGHPDQHLVLGEQQDL